MNELIGRTLKGKYRITAQLGEGAMGEVFRGVEVATGRAIAVKVMHPALMREPGMLTRFRREATAMRRMKHPNMVEVFAHGVDEGLVFLAMELVDGTDLATLAGGKALAPERATSIVADVLSALAEAHARGVVHRDIKPENVMVGGERGDVAKLIDFGIAKSKPETSSERAARRDSVADIDDEPSIEDSIADGVDLASSLELTTAGTIVGSPGYMAPEQWTGRPVDARTDVYACGVLLYQLLTGRLPFEDENPFNLAMRQLGEVPAAPHALVAGVREALSAIALRAMRPAPEARYQTAAEMRDALRAEQVAGAIASSLSLAATLPVPITAPIEPEIRIAKASYSLTLPLGLEGLVEAAPDTVPFPATGARDTAPIPLPLVTTRAPSLGERTLVLDAVAPAAARSPGRNGRSTPVPVAPPRAVAVTPAAPASHRAARVAARLRLVLPLAAAFLALGFVLGILLWMPAR